jgi:GNAT superfamily N-acetyltransferase
MTELIIIEQAVYNPDLALDYDELLASLHLVENFKHSPEDIQAVCDAEGSSFYLGMLGNVAVAMTTLIHPVFSMGHRTAIIEDVAVNRNYRGNGFGLAMMDFIETEAIRLGSNRIELHSGNARKEAHGLYRKTGFEVFDTNLFRKEL